jgi:hypothetical protein
VPCRAFSSSCSSPRRSLSPPKTQLVDVVEKFSRQPIVLHHLAAFAKGRERLHLAREEIRPVRVIDLEVQHVVVDEREEIIARVHANAAEHALCADTVGDAPELFDHEGAEAVADCHFA